MHVKWLPPQKIAHPFALCRILCLPSISQLGFIDFEICWATKNPWTTCDSLASALRPLDYCVDAGFSAPEINGSEPRLQGMLMGWSTYCYLCDFQSENSMIPGFSFGLFVAIWSYSLPCSCNSARTARDGKEKGLMILNKPGIQRTRIHAPLERQEEADIHMILIGDNNLYTKTL